MNDGWVDYNLDDAARKRTGIVFENRRTGHALAISTESANNVTLLDAGHLRVLVISRGDGRVMGDIVLAPEEGVVHVTDSEGKKFPPIGIDVNDFQRVEVRISRECTIGIQAHRPALVE